MAGPYDVPETLAGSETRWARALVRRQEVAIDSINRTYNAGLTSILSAWDELAQRIEAAQPVPIISGGQLPEESTEQGPVPAWVFQQDRYRELQRQIGQLTTSIGNETRDQVVSGRMETFELGSRTAASDAASLGISSFASVNRFAVEAFAGSSTWGPIAALLDSFATDTQADAGFFARDAIAVGIVRGRHPSVIARTLSNGLESLTASRARTIARTELLRAYRQGTKEALRQNKALTPLWIWRSAADERTCIACWAQHGTEHPAEEGMDTHPNCRCVMVPVRQALQLPSGQVIQPTGPSTVIPSGAELFGDLPPATRRKILGPERFELYNLGAISFSDLRTTRHSPIWGANTAAITPLTALRRTARVPGSFTGGGPDRPFEISGVPGTVNPAFDRNAPPVPPAELERRLVESERERVLDKYETLVLVDPKTGQELYRKGGTSDRVDVTPTETLIMEGMILTHNHPSAADARLSDGTRPGGSGLSFPDVKLAFTDKLAGIRATGPGWVHELLLTEEGRAAQQDRATPGLLHGYFSRAETATYNAGMEELRAFVASELAAGRSGAAAENARLADKQTELEYEHHHKLWTEVQARLAADGKHWFTYERKPAPWDLTVP